MSVLARLAPSLLVGSAILLLAGCSALKAVIDDDTPSRSGGDRFPDVLAVELRPRGDRVYDIVVTLSSPYDTPERYADGWRVMDPDGGVLGTHTLMHDHATEQPFTRTQPGLRVPDGIDEVTVEGRDRTNGFGGQTVTVVVPE